jgi:uridine phosphorylase
MSQLPDHPDLDQLRRRAKELQRRSPAGTTLAAAQLAVARQHGFSSWPRLREAVDTRRTAAGAALTPDKHRAAAVHPAAEFLASARDRGWDPGTLPGGAVFTAQTFITTHLDTQPDRYQPSATLTPTNGRVFTTVDGPPVAVACLGVGAPAVVTLLEHLVGLGVRSFVAVGPAPAVAAGLEWGTCVVLDRALRDDGVSQHYAAPARYAHADGPLSDRLFAAAQVRGLDPRRGSTWTVPTPYRTTAEELVAYRDEGVLVTELTTAALFAVASALGARAAGAVTVTRILGDPTEGPPPGHRAGQTLTLLEAAVDAVREAAA